MTTLIPKFDLKDGGATPTGAVNRPINEKLAEFISVKDFGAVGNGTTDDTTAIQAAINACGGKNLFFPQGTYGISASLLLLNGINIVGEGNVAGTAPTSITPLGANYTNASFKIFTFASGNIDSISMQNIKLIGGGYAVFKDLATGYLDKLYCTNCVFQANLTTSIAGTGTASGYGIYESIITGCSFISSGAGVYCDGPYNINRIENSSFEIMNGSYLSLGNPTPYPTAAVHFVKNRCETVVTPASAPCINLEGTTFNVNIQGNYFENVFTSVLVSKGVAALVFNDNFHTNTTTGGTITIENSTVEICNNASLIGLAVNFTGTTNVIGRISGNRSVSFNTIRTTTTNSQNPTYIESKGISLAAVPTIYDAQTNQVKFVNLTNNTAVNFFAFAGGSSSGTGYPSRACMAVKATILLDITDSNGVNCCATNQYLITATCYAGTTFTGTISTIIDQTAGKFTLTNSSASTTTYVVQGKYNTGTGSTFATGARACILYEYIADEVSSSGITVS